LFATSLASCVASLLRMDEARTASGHISVAVAR
jgi:hypothetical protein